MDLTGLTAIIIMGVNYTLFADGNTLDGDIVLIMLGLLLSIGLLFGLFTIVPTLIKHTTPKKRTKMDRVLFCVGVPIVVVTVLCFLMSQGL